MPKGILFVAITFLFLFGPNDLYGAEEADYLTVVEKLKVDEKPANHAKVAAWCKKNYPDKLAYHLQQHKLYLFGKKEAALGDNPSASKLSSLYKLAQKYNLQEQYIIYHDQWGALELAKKMKSMKGEDAKSLSSVMEWAIKNDLTHLEQVKTLASKYFELKADDEKMRRRFGLLKINDTWKSIEDIDLAQLQDLDMRLKIHEESLASLKIIKPKPPKRVKNPIQQWASSGGSKIKGTNRSGGEAKYLVWTSSSSNALRPQPLVIVFHGGGSGGYAKALDQAQIIMRGLMPGAQNYIMMAPIAQVHIGNSWGHRTNVMNWLDALEEVFQMYNVDRHRIYMHGYSMGSNGIGQYSWLTPEVAAAYSFGGCSIWVDQWKPPKSMLGKHFMIVHGLKEAAWRSKAKKDFVRITEGLGGKCHVHDFANWGHDLSSREYDKDIFEFYKKHKSDKPVDWKVIRKLYLSHFKEIAK